MPAVELQNNSTLARLGDVRVGGIYQGPSLVWAELPDIVDLRLDTAPTGDVAFHFKWFAEGSRSPGIGAWDWRAERNTGGGWANIVSAIAPTWDGGSQEFWGPIISAGFLPDPGVTWRYRLTLITLYGNVAAECDYTSVLDRHPIGTIGLDGLSMNPKEFDDGNDDRNC